MNNDKKINKKIDNRSKILKEKSENGEKKFSKNLSKIKFAYNIDKLSSEDLKKSLERIRENPIEPFAFLTKIPCINENFPDLKIKSSASKISSVAMPKLTDIDVSFYL